MESVSQNIKNGKLVTTQACYKAQIKKHEEDEETGPMIGPLDVKDLWPATGLDEWCIQNGPAVGLVMSKIILEGKAHIADVESLDPKHWMYGATVKTIPTPSTSEITPTTKIISPKEGTAAFDNPRKITADESQPQPHLYNVARATHQPRSGALHRLTTDTN